MLKINATKFCAWSCFAGMPITCYLWTGGVPDSSSSWDWNQCRRKHPGRTSLARVYPSRRSHWADLTHVWPVCNHQNCWNESSQCDLIGQWKCNVVQTLLDPVHCACTCDWPGREGLAARLLNVRMVPIIDVPVSRNFRCTHTHTLIHTCIHTYTCTYPYNVW